MALICEACFHAHGPDVHLRSFPGGFLCAECVWRAIDLVTGKAPLISGTCMFCTKSVAGVALGESREHVLCALCAPMLADALRDFSPVRPGVGRGEAADG